MSNQHYRAARRRCLLVMAAAWLLSWSVAAETLYVSRLAAAGAANGSRDAPCRSLAAALRLVAPDTDSIEVIDGETYEESVQLPFMVSLLSTHLPRPTITVSGQSAVTVTGGDLDGFIVAFSGNERGAGAIILRDGNVRNCIIDNNPIGIELIGNDGEAQIADCVLTHNRAAIVLGLQGPPPKATIRDSSFIANGGSVGLSLARWGGAICSLATAGLIVEDCLFEQNQPAGAQLTGVSVASCLLAANLIGGRGGSIVFSRNAVGDTNSHPALSILQQQVFEISENRFDAPLELVAESGLRLGPGSVQDNIMTAGMSVRGDVRAVVRGNLMIDGPLRLWGTPTRLEIVQNTFVNECNCLQQAIVFGGGGLLSFSPPRNRARIDSNIFVDYECAILRATPVDSYPNYSCFHRTPCATQQVYDDEALAPEDDRMTGNTRVDPRLLYPRTSNYRLSPNSPPEVVTGGRNGSYMGAYPVIDPSACIDEDEDGFGIGDIRACPEPWIVDCDDTTADANPLATEICDGIDNDCDGLLDEGFDGDGDGVPPCRGDCDDQNPKINPAAEENCDGIDNNCDGQVDEGCCTLIRITTPGTVDLSQYDEDQDGVIYGNIELHTPGPVAIYGKDITLRPAIDVCGSRSQIGVYMPDATDVTIFNLTVDGFIGGDKFEFAAGTGYWTDGRVGFINCTAQNCDIGFSVGEFAAMSGGNTAIDNGWAVRAYDAAIITGLKIRGTHEVGVFLRSGDGHTISGVSFDGELSSGSKYGFISNMLNSNSSVTITGCRFSSTGGSSRHVAVRPRGLCRGWTLRSNTFEEAFAGEYLFLSENLDGLLFEANLVKAREPLVFVGSDLAGRVIGRRYAAQIVGNTLRDVHVSNRSAEIPVLLEGNYFHGYDDRHRGSALRLWNRGGGPLIVQFNRFYYQEIQLKDGPAILRHNSSFRDVGINNALAGNGILLLNAGVSGSVIEDNIIVVGRGGYEPIRDATGGLALAASRVLNNNLVRLSPPWQPPIGNFRIPPNFYSTFELTPASTNDRAGFDEFLYLTPESRGPNLDLRSDAVNQPPAHLGAVPVNAGDAADKAD